MNVTVIYGSDSGNTKAVASKIAKGLNGRSLDIKQAAQADFEGCDLLVLGCPTYGLGDLQDDWENRISLLEKANLSGRVVALFGLGDQMTYPDSFVDAIGLLHDRVAAKGAKVVGFTETDGYDFGGSQAVRDGRFVGLALDEDTQAGKTGARVAAWIAQVNAEINALVGEPA